jgi:hypothetical protein
MFLSLLPNHFSLGLMRGELRNMAQGALVVKYDRHSDALVLADHRIG